MTVRGAARAAGGLAVLPAFKWGSDLNEDHHMVPREAAVATVNGKRYTAQIACPGPGHWFWSVWRDDGSGAPGERWTVRGESVDAVPISEGQERTNPEARAACQEAADSDHWGEDMTWWGHALRGAAEADT